MSHSDQPKPTTGNWTAITVNAMISGLESQTKNPYQVIADEHNAALAAEREKFTDAAVQYEALEKEVAQLREQLAAKRSKVQTLVDALKLAETDLRLAFSTNKESFGYSKGLEAVVNALAKKDS